MANRIRLFLKLLRLKHDPIQILTWFKLHDAVRDCSSVLDVGCGATSPLRWFRFERLVGIEGYEPSLNAAQKNATHGELVLGDIRQLERYFKSDQFEACIALDVIEHLTKEDGLKLLEAMERIASRKVVFFTPNGFLPQRHTERDDLQEHLSGWEALEMERRGYHVTGMLGPKLLRGEYHMLRWRPKVLWAIVSLVCQLCWTRSHPATAAAILCVKMQK